MLYNYHNTFCRWCGEWVPKGTGIYHNFQGGITLCKECNELRDHKLNSKAKKAKKVRQFNKVQPSLFDNEEV